MSVGNTFHFWNSVAIATQINYIDGIHEIDTDVLMFYVLCIIHLCNYYK